MKTLLTTLLMMFVALPAVADRGEQKKSFGEYEVHYMGLTSNFLTEEVAEAYGITRSRSLGYLSISVLENFEQGGMPEARAATITGTIKNLIGQSRELEFKEIRETAAIYYISTFRFDDKDVYRIDLKVKPEGHGVPLDVNFTQRFYEEE
jgi:hypothetical protein